jgi:predicted nucleic acid-binding protein
MKVVGLDRRRQHPGLRSTRGFPVSRSGRDANCGARRGIRNLVNPLAMRSEFLAIVTHPRIYAPPTPLPRALDQLDTWLESPTLVLLTESADRWAALRTILARGRVAGPQVHDARIAAVCRQHGVRRLWSADRDLIASRACGRKPVGQPRVKPARPWRVNEKAIFADGRNPSRPRNNMVDGAALNLIKHCRYVIVDLPDHASTNAHCLERATKRGANPLKTLGRGGKNAVRHARSPESVLRAQ